MKTANERLLDDFVKHQIRLISYGNGLSKSSVKKLKATEGEVARILLVYAEKLSGKSLTTKMGKRNLAKMEKEIRAVRHEAWLSIRKEISSELRELLKEETEFVVKAIQKNMPVALDLKTPKPKTPGGLAEEVEGAAISVWFKDAEQKEIVNIRNRFKMSLQDQELNSPGQIVKAVVGTAIFKRKDGVLRKSWNGIDSVVTSSIAKTRSKATRDVTFANPDTIGKEYFVATLDIHTTFQCASHDGKVFPVKQGPVPPLHFRCRSLRIMLMEYRFMKDRPFNSNVEKKTLDDFTRSNGLSRVGSAKDLPYGYKTQYRSFNRNRKRELMGVLPAETNFAQWFKTQNKAFQDEYLGVTRAKLYREGGLEISQFTNRLGNTLTLDQLKARNLLP